MDADYSIELGPSAPALEIPWQDPEGRLHYVELRGDPTSLDPDVADHRIADRNVAAQNVALINLIHIPEARQFPALGRFLIEVNSPKSDWQTVKCDVWPDETEAAENLYSRGFEQSCYVDIVLAGHVAALRCSLETHQRLARELAQSLEANATLEATAEVVVRRCYFHQGSAGESDAGYCMTLFLSAYGDSPAEAAECWERAMGFAAGCVLKLQAHEGCAKAQELS
jgi:hypothetical protein